VLTTAQLEARRRLPANVPCGPCRACCSHDRVVLGPRDDPRAYRWHEEGGYAVLDRKDNGECVYLSSAGCSIHSKPPEICRRMDCRVLYLLTPADQRQRRVAENPHMALVYGAGLARLSALLELSGDISSSAQHRFALPNDLRAPPLSHRDAFEAASADEAGAAGAIAAPPDEATSAGLAGDASAHLPAA
jgi:Putative zinc- or iron-chelating domain